jgi:hypothetical protein
LFWHWQEREIAMPVQCDYIAATYVSDDPTHLNFQTSLWQLEGGKPMAFRGFRGINKDGIFIGYREYDDRVMVQGIGSSANRAVLIFQQRSSGKNYSVARFDAQVTFAIDDADRTITFCSPRKRYKSMRISSISERGETIYVGSPTSSYRLRVYNKTAQSGLKPEKGEYIRFEITFRNTLADSAYKAYLSGDMKAYFLGYLSQMVDEVTLNLVRYILDKDRTIEPRIFETEDNKGIDGTKMWLENIVIPCIQKLYLREPDYISELMKRLDKILDSGV